MSRFLFGIGLPFAILALSIWWRIHWTYDVHPIQPLWCFWVASLVITSIQIGYGVRAYWWPCGQRRRFRN